jgi:hypothetical protein
LFVKKYKSGYFSFVTRQSFESGTKIFPPQTTKNWPTLLFLFRKKRVSDLLQSMGAARCERKNVDWDSTPWGWIILGLHLFIDIF